MSSWPLGPAEVLSKRRQLHGTEAQAFDAVVRIYRASQDNPSASATCAEALKGWGADWRDLPDKIPGLQQGFLEALLNEQPDDVPCMACDQVTPKEYMLGGNCYSCFERRLVAFGQSSYAIMYEVTSNKWGDQDYGGIQVADLIPFQFGGTWGLYWLPVTEGRTMPEKVVSLDGKSATQIRAELAENLWNQARQ